MDTEPRFSVVVPLYNKAPFIAHTLASVYSQDMSAAEVIVIDDGSTDGGAEIVARLYPQVDLIRQVNCGEGAARNAGVNRAHCDWIAFLDADDIWHANHLSELRRVISEFESAHLVATAYEIVDRHSTSGHRLVKRPRRAEVDLFKMTSWNLGAFWTSAVAVRRSSLQGLGGFSSIQYGADVEAWIRLALKYPCAYSTAITATYVTGNPGVMQSRAAAYRAAEIDSVLIKDLRDLPGLGLVLDAAASGSSRVSKQQARRYRNGRVGQALRIALRNGHEAQARVLVCFFRLPIGLCSWPYIVIYMVQGRIRKKLIEWWLGLRSRLVKRSETPHRYQESSGFE